MTKKKKFLLAVSVIFLSVFFALIFLEILLRVFNISYPNFYTVDEYLAIVLRPGAQGWWTREGKSYVKINSFGQRDVEHSLKNEKGCFRIAILGDSYCEAFQVPLEKAFWYLMQKELKKRCDQFNKRCVEAINFGVSGYGTAQELQMLRQRVWRFDPDLVLLALFTGNDIRNNSKELSQEEIKFYFFLDENGTLVPDYSFRENFNFKIANSFIGKYFIGPLYYETYIGQNLIHFRNVLRYKRQLAAAQKRGEIGLDENIYLSNPSKEWQKAWRLTQRLLLQMNKEVRARGKKFVVVVLSNSIQVNPNEKKREKFVRKLGLTSTDDLFYPDYKIKTFLDQNNIPCLLLAPQFWKWAKENQKCLHGFKPEDNCAGHWNELGHRLASIKITSFICQLYEQENKN